MSIQVTVSVEEKESGNVDFEIKVNSLEEGATECEIEIAKVITASIKMSISNMRPKNKDKFYAH